MRSRAGKTTRATHKVIRAVSNSLQPPPTMQLSNLLRGLQATAGSSDSLGSSPPAFVIASAALVEC